MNWRALAATFLMGAKKVFAERVVLLGQIAVYCVLVSSYAVFFTGVDPTILRRFGLKIPDLVWYLAITQIVIGCTALHWRELENEIASGALETRLTRPIPIWTLSLAEWFGQYVVRVVIVAPFGCLVAGAIGGGWPTGGPLSLLLAFPCLLIAGLLFLCLHWLVGCASLWASPAEPVYRLWQKTMFLVGARSSPLLLYPAWSQGLVWLTPFPAMLAVPGNLVLGPVFPRLGVQLVLQVLWLAVGLWASARMARKITIRTMRLG